MKLPRIRVLRNKSRPLPLEIRRRLDDLAERLANRLPGLDRELGVPYPLVEVSACAWVAYDADAKPLGMPFARSACPVTYGNLIHFAVELSPATLVAFGDSELIEGVLAHEFQHHVWTTIHYAKMAMGLIPMESTLPSDSEYIANYERFDEGMQVSPSDWLTPRLESLVQRVEAAEAPEMRSLQDRMLSEWMNKDLPVVPLDMGYRIQGRIAWDEAVIRKARRLGLLPAGS